MQPITNKNDKPAKKKKTSILEALFGGGSAAGSGYRIIYFSISIAMGKNGNEQVASIIYGNDTGIFNASIPATSIVYIYNKDAVLPTINISKGGFMGGGARAEIILPVGYSFMPSPITLQKEVIEEIVENKLNDLPLPIVPTQQQPEVHSMPSMRDPFDIPIATEAQKNEPPQPVHEDTDPNSTDLNNETSVKVETESVDTNSTQKTESTMSSENARSEQQEVEESDLFPDNEFSLGFDDELMREKINRFMERHNPTEGKKTTVLPEKKADPRTIEEIKKETSDAEVDKVLKNAKQMQELIFAETGISPEIADERSDRKTEKNN